MKHSHEQNIKASNAIERIMVADDCFADTDPNKIEQYILDGNTVLLFSGDTGYAVVNLIKVEKRAMPS